MSTSLARPLGRDDDVRGLDVAVNDPALGGVHQGLRDLKRDVDRLADRQAPGRLDALPDRHAFDVLEGDVVERPVLPDAEDPRDIFVVEPRGRSPLLVEPRDDFGVSSLDRAAAA